MRRLCVLLRAVARAVFRCCQSRRQAVVATLSSSSSSWSVDQIHPQWPPSQAPSSVQHPSRQPCAASRHPHHPSNNTQSPLAWRSLSCGPSHHPQLQWVHRGGPCALRVLTACAAACGVRVCVSYMYTDSPILARALTAHSNSIQSSLSLTHMRQPLHTVWWVYLNGIFVMVLTRPTGLCIVHSLYLNYYSVYSTAQARVGPHPYRLRPSRRPWPEARPRPVDPMLATLSVLSQPDAVCRQPAAPPWTGVPTLTTAQYRIATT